jgi:hypothetical protein
MRQVDHTFTVKIENQNRDLYSLVYCMVKKQGHDTLFNADRNGLITINFPIDTIHLLCGLCPERKSSFAVTDPKQNYITFNFEPWITEIFFKSFSLHFAGEYLEGRHPLLDDKTYKFYREE